tara:strand:- start:3 stop:965 length:963 start_codon:yes stop_codon:yes gene_type:complete
MGISKLDTLEGRPDFIKRYIKSHGKTESDILAADSTETAASSRVAHQGWTIPAGGNGNPNAMRETVIAMNIGSDIGADDDAGLGVSGAGGGGGGGGGGFNWTTKYSRYSQTPDAGTHTHAAIGYGQLHSSRLSLRLLSTSMSGGMTDPGNEHFGQWSNYGYKDDGYGNRIESEHGQVQACRIYSGSNVALGGHDGYNMDGSWIFFCSIGMMEMMGSWEVFIYFHDYMGAASNYGNGNPGPNPWADSSLVGHGGYQLVSNFPNQPAFGVDNNGNTNNQNAKFFALVKNAVDNNNFSNLHFRFDFAQPNVPPMSVQVQGWYP